MGKKRSRSSYTSKGERRSISKTAVRLAKTGQSAFAKELNKLKAWRQGQNPWITIPGPSKNMQFIRVRANNHWGDPKKATRSIFTREDEVA